MTIKAALLIAAALIATNAAAAPKHRRPSPAASPSAEKPVEKPAEKTPPTQAGPFDSQDPASLISLLASVGANAQVTNRDKQGLMLKVDSPAGSFIAQFDGCNQQGRTCAAFQFDAAAQARTATIAEINGFNQTSLVCRIIQDKSGKPHMLYSSLVFASNNRQDMTTHLAAWQNCLADFGAFLKDPPGYLAAAP